MLMLLLLLLLLLFVMLIVVLVVRLAVLGRLFDRRVEVWVQARRNDNRVQRRLQP